MNVPPTIPNIDGYFTLGGTLGDYIMHYFL